MTTVFILRVILRTQCLGLSFRVIGDDQFDRIQYGHATQGHFIQVLAHTEFQQAYVDQVFTLSHTDGFCKLADAFRGIPSAAHTADGRHTRIVPAIHLLLVDQLQQFTLAHHRIIQVQAGKLILM
ncbi:hypothetical protein D9M68_743040 [compost metagenome]